jgi:hypothetical protein
MTNTQIDRMFKYIETARTAGEVEFFTTKAAQKNALEDLSRAYDILRRLATTYDLPYSLAHYRAAKHEELFGGNASHINIIRTLVEMRGAIKDMEVRKPETREQRERRIAASSPIANIAAEFEPLKVGVKEDFINQVRNTIARLTKKYTWAELNRLPYHSYDYKAWAVARSFLTINNYDRNAPREINEEYLDKKATQYADDQIDAFVHKLSLKLVDLTDVELHNVRPNSFQFTLTGNLNGKRVAVTQNIKYCVSNQGTPYVQWPALIYVDGQRVSEKDFHDNYVTTEV